MSFSALVLAGTRPGGDPLAQQIGVAHKALVEIAGEPILTRVVTALRGGGAAQVAVSCVEGPVAELARLLVSLGATDAINLDGGGSATLVHRGHLLNRPYSSVDQPGPESRPVATALLFDAISGGRRGG